MRKLALITGYSCNNNCIFCYDSEKRDLPDLSTGQIRSRLSQARRKGCDYVDFLGGEFTLRKDALYLVRYAKSLGYRVAITTNGRLLSYPALFRRYRDAGLDSVIFSVHGHSAGLHDRLTRVEGSFRQLQKAFDNARELGYPLFANVVITEQNLVHLPGIARFLIKEGCGNAEFIFIDPTTGSGRTDFDRIVPHLAKASRYVKEALDIGKAKEHWHVRYMPLCYLAGYESQVSEIQDRFKSEFHLGPEFANWDVAGSRRAVGRMKPEQCGKCILRSRCEGIWQEYAKRRGTQEIKPVTKLTRSPPKRRVMIAPAKRKGAKGIDRLSCGIIA